MPDRRRHRGKHPSDDELFHPRCHAALRAAVEELSWLLSRGYNETSALKLVGDRHALRARQRTAVARCACSDAQRAGRAAREVDTDALRGEAVAIDGFNLLIVLESALSGGLVLAGRDGARRDLASIHGTYRAVEETGSAIELAGETLAALGAREVAWYLDRPVSNSGRLKVLLAELAEANGWRWEIELLDNPDRALASGSEIVVSSDSWVLDGCTRWVNLAAAVIERSVPGAWLLRL